MSLFSRICFAWVLLACSAYADNSATPPRLPGRVDIQQKLNTQIPLDLMFRDESGKVIRLRDELRGKPVLLNFMYYRCPMLCSMVMEGIASTLAELKFDVGKEFDVITVSIDPRDMPDQAAAKKEKYIKRYGRFSAVIQVACSVVNERSFVSVAPYSLTGMFTRPNAIAPLHKARAILGSSSGIQTKGREALNNLSCGVNLVQG